MIQTYPMTFGLSSLDVRDSGAIESEVRKCTEAAAVSESLCLLPHTSLETTQEVALRLPLKLENGYPSFPACPKDTRIDHAQEPW